MLTLVLLRLLALTQFVLIILTSPVILPPSGTTTLQSRGSPIAHLNMVADNQATDSSLQVGKVPNRSIQPTVKVRTAEPVTSSHHKSLYRSQTDHDLDASKRNTLWSSTFVRREGTWLMHCGPSGHTIVVSLTRYSTGNSVVFLISEAISAIQELIQKYGNQPASGKAFTWTQNGLKLFMESNYVWPSYTSDFLETLSCLWAAMKDYGYGIGTYTFYDGVNEIGKGKIG